MSPPAEDPQANEFLLRAFFDNDLLVGARWWNESFQQAQSGALARRKFLASFSPAALGLLVGGGALATALGMRSCDDDDQDGAALDFDALALQRSKGWDVGSAATQELVFANRVQMDARLDVAYSQHLPNLARDLAPRDARLQPFAVLTLFQALAGAPGGERLLRATYPVYDDRMKTAYQRGEALAKLSAGPGAPRDVALVLDLPGPESVAVAAALANAFAPVFILDNWPHPRAVVPSQQTLGAAVFFRPFFVEANDKRPAGAPPVFVLDAARLTPYRDEPDRFDNRYVVNLPSAPQLAGLGIKRLLYVRPDGTLLQELDDLNQDFVALDQGGIAVDALALSDFQRAQIEDGVAPSRSSSDGYHYRGHPGYNIFFWNRYGWAPAPRLGSSRSARSAPPARPLPARTAYRPIPRPTIFNTRAVGGVSGVGKQKPSGFGRVSVRSPDGGRTVRNVYSGSRRSGSFGRSRSSYSG